MREADVARNNLPTPERYAKGDVIIHIESERSTIPTASVRVIADRLEKLHSSKVINNAQFVACKQLRAWRSASLNEVISRVRIATWQNCGMPSGVWHGNVEAILHRQWCYNFLRNPSNGICPTELNVIEKVVCDGMAIRDALRGNGSTKTQRFTSMVDRLKKVIDSMPKCN